MSGKTIAKILLPMGRNNYFLRTVHSQNSERIIKYKSAYLGSQFQENLKQQWLTHCASNHEIGFFTYISKSFCTSNKNDFIDIIQDAKHLSNSQVPFGMACIKNYLEQNSEITEEQGNNKRKKKNDAVEISSNTKMGTLLQSIILVSPKNSRNTYFQWQRQRKIWWSRFSVSPGHYSIQDEKIDITKQFIPETYLSNINQILDEKIHAVNIIVDLEAQCHPVEIIELFEQNPKKGISLKNESGETVPHFIISTINLEAACLGVLAECMDENGNMILHHKLAPFQYRLVCDFTDIEDCSELSDLARYLCGILRKSHLQTLYVNNERRPQNDVFCESDKMGIPYCLILRKEALRNGFIYLRNRDTTLEEQLHVSDVPDYLVKLCKHF